MKQQHIPPVQIQYGHNHECIVLLFNRRTEALAFTPAALDEHISALQQVKTALLAHTAKGKPGG